ncbi:hypothetical protein DYB32_000484 [Aphanomyces invadans]|uniref:Rab-GAP TBC domain-containing protein n=1 Tax=Aphanomyces invadans TaxID=157072 RepID=A0A3R6WTV1_9STRA|nr:hypothetical protein DYB32_000484 [Aphanomyces invadans]
MSAAPQHHAPAFGDDERSHGSFLKCMRPKERFCLPRTKARAGSMHHTTSAVGSPPTPKRRFFSNERTRASSIHYQHGQPPTASCDCVGLKSLRCQYASLGCDSPSSPSRGRGSVLSHHVASAHNREIEMTSMVSAKKKKWEEKFTSKEWELDWLQKWRKRTLEEPVPSTSSSPPADHSRPSLAERVSDQHFQQHAGFRRRSLSDAGHMGFMGFSLGQWQVDTMLRSGVPIEYRGQVWWLCSGAAQKRSTASISDQYESLLWRADEVRVDVSTEIEKDLYRTFPHEPDTRDEREASISELRRLLSMYSLRNPKVGYCQSMNFLGAMLLVYLGEEEAFWVLACIVEDLVPGYHTKSMVGSRVDQHVFAALIEQKLPHVAHHLQALHVHLAPVTFKWFLCLFVNTLPLETTLRVWDVFFSEGSKVIHRLGLTLIKLLAPDILAADEAFDVYELLKFSPRTLATLMAPHRKAPQWRKQDDCFCDTLLRLAFDKAFLGPFPYRSIVDLRAFYQTYVEGEVARAADATDTSPAAVDTSGAAAKALRRTDEYDFVDDFKAPDDLDYEFLVTSSNASSGSGCAADSSWRTGSSAGGPAAMGSLPTERPLIENYW